MSINEQEFPIVLILHGGAKPIADEKKEAHREGCRHALEAGWKVLSSGGPAVEATVAAIKVLEDDPTFNAGYGATLNPDGVVRLDAGLMEGRTQNAGAVACVEGIRHPITITQALLEEKEVLLVADFARKFALEHSVGSPCNRYELVTREAMSSWQRMLEEQNQGRSGGSGKSSDTVGCVARDRTGSFASGVSTGGIGEHRPGRVGDSALVGAGFFADDAVGGAVLTGEGEALIRLCIAREVTKRMEQGADPETAMRTALEEMLKRTDGKAGGIAINNEGRIGWWHTDENMAVAYRTETMSEPAVYTHKKEEGRPPAHQGVNNGG